jgi:hypothetical protein
MITRRGALLIGSGAMLSGRLGFAAGEPWKDKKPNNWSESDVRVILNKSPWAKQVRAELDPELAGGPQGRGGPEGGPPPGGGPGGFPGGGFPPGGGSDAWVMKLTVLWASARPVRIAASLISATSPTSM